MPLYYELLISKALRYGTFKQGITQFYLLYAIHTFIHKWKLAILRGGGSVQL